MLVPHVSAEDQRPTGRVFALGTGQIPDLVVDVLDVEIGVTLARALVVTLIALEHSLFIK